MAENQDTKVVTGKVRLSYAHLFEPFAQNPGNDPKYSVTILIPKSDTTTLRKIKRAQAAAAEAGKGKFGGKVPSNLKTTLYDGDEDADLEKNPEMAGHMYMALNSKTKPGIIDLQKIEITDSSEVYSGCWARISMNAFAYNTNGNRGISFGLNNVQKVADDKYLGGRSNAADDFDDDFEDEDEDASSLI